MDIDVLKERLSDVVAAAEAAEVDAISPAPRPMPKDIVVRSAMIDIADAAAEAARAGGELALADAIDDAVIAARGRLAGAMAALRDRGGK